MKVMIDTNIIISGALNPSGFTARALYKALSTPYEPVVCDYIVDELHRKSHPLIRCDTIPDVRCDVLGVAP